MDIITTIQWMPAGQKPQLSNQYSLLGYATPSTNVMSLASGNWQL